MVKLFQAFLARCTFFARLERDIEMLVSVCDNELFFEGKGLLPRKQESGWNVIMKILHYIDWTFGCASHGRSLIPC